MKYKEYLKTTGETVRYLEIVDYFIAHFFDIKADGLIQHFDARIVDITDTPIIQTERLERARLAEIGAYFSENFRAFVFKENDSDSFVGRFNIDFVRDDLANVEIYLCATGFFASRKIDKKYASVLKTLEQKFGQPDETLRQIYASLIPEFYSHRACWNYKKLIISFGKTTKIPGIKAIPGISLIITKKEFMS